MRLLDSWFGVTLLAIVTFIASTGDDLHAQSSRGPGGARSSRLESPIASPTASAPATVAPPTAPISPRIAHLLERLQRDANGDAVTEFWARAAESTTPFLEPVAGDTTVRLATFVYRDSSARMHVTVAGGVLGYLPGSMRMHRIAGTDIWHRSVVVPADIRVAYMFQPDDDFTPPWARPGGAPAPPAAVLDPLNPRIDSLQGQRSVLVGPRADSQPLARVVAGVPRGRVESHAVYSHRLGTQRTVHVYTPPGYDADAARRTGGLPVLVMFDGGAYTSSRWIPTPTILDNLLATGRITPVIGLFVPSVQAERFQELSPNEAFAEFVAEELMSWARDHYAISGDPSRTVIGGSSLGALAASFIALRSPERFGNVISQSGSYWWAPASDSQPEWLTRQVATRPRLAVRFYVDVGQYEVDRTRSGPGQVAVNQHFRDVLMAKGYDVAYRLFPGGHDYMSWRGTIVEALARFFAPR